MSSHKKIMIWETLMLCASENVQALLFGEHADSVAVL